MYEQQQLRALIETAVDAIISISADGTIKLFNAAAERIFGYASDDVIGKDIAILMPRSHGDRHSDYIERFLKTGEARIIGIGRQVEGLRSDGTTFPMHLSVGAFGDGERPDFVGIVRDLSGEMAERKRRETLQHQLELIGRHSAVSEMGAALAHELNQPLTAIDLFLSAAEKRLADNPEAAREIFRRVRDEAQRAGNIVRRIREMVERSDGERSAFVLASVAESAVELCRLVDRDKAEITIEPLPTVGMFGDPVQIRMILVNLVKNALDATDGQTGAKVRLRAHVAPKAVRLEVLDNGPGIAPEVAGKLFEPFSSTKVEGLGIGLSICRTIAEGHGGKLELIPQEEQIDSLGGAAFALTLPLPEDGHE
ncbi:MAG: PAS domain S-box protein [Parvularcula sp.]|jgi:two-component system sensor kinase FixL|nr:PAS domain S-box protein [Parvularcula sp.]